jgi:hypothetical protein
MGRTCTVCAHPAYDAIAAALNTDRSIRDIAVQFGVSKTALHRHWREHVPGQASQAPSHIGISTTTRRGSRLWAFAKWGLVIGVGVLVWRRVSARASSSP